MRFSLLLCAILTTISSTPVAPGQQDIPTAPADGLPAITVVPVRTRNTKVNATPKQVFYKLLNKDDHPAIPDSRLPAARDIARTAAKALSVSFLKSHKATPEQTKAIAAIHTQKELAFAAQLLTAMPLQPPQQDNDDLTGSERKMVLNMYLAQSFLEAYADGSHWPPSKNKQAIHAYFYASAIEDAIEAKQSSELARISKLIIDDPMLPVIKTDPDFKIAVDRLDKMSKVADGAFSVVDVQVIKKSFQLLRTRYPFRFF